MLCYWLACGKIVSSVPLAPLRRAACATFSVFTNR
jgi:hypothetical protein